MLIWEGDKENSKHFTQLGKWRFLKQIALYQFSTLKLRIASNFEGLFMEFMWMNMMMNIFEILRFSPIIRPRVRSLQKSRKCLEPLWSSNFLAFRGISKFVREKVRWEVNNFWLCFLWIFQCPFCFSTCDEGKRLNIFSTITHDIELCNTIYLPYLLDTTIFSSLLGCIWTCKPLSI